MQEITCVVTEYSCMLPLRHFMRFELRENCDVLEVRWRETLNPGFFATGEAVDIQYDVHYVQYYFRYTNDQAGRNHQ